MQAVPEMPEIVHITVDSGAAKREWPIRKKGVTRTNATKTVRLAVANGSPTHVERDARLEFIRDQESKCMVTPFFVKRKSPKPLMKLGKNHPKDSSRVHRGQHAESRAERRPIRNWLQKSVDVARPAHLGTLA